MSACGPTTCDKVAYFFLDCHKCFFLCIRCSSTVPDTYIFQEKCVMNLITVQVVQSCHEDVTNTMREMFIRISDEQWILVTGAVKHILQRILVYT